MTLFDDTNTHYSDSSSTTTLTEPQPENAPQHSEQQAAATEQTEGQSQSSSEEQKPAEDFASALESFTTEAEESTGEDHVIHGTELQLTPTHVFVEIGAKSDGAVLIDASKGREAKPTSQPGDA